MMDKKPEFVKASDKPEAAANGSRRSQFIASVRKALQDRDAGYLSDYAAVQTVRHALVVLDRKAKGR